MIQFKTWPYGTMRKGTVEVNKFTPLKSGPRATQFVTDELNEGHVLFGEAADFNAKDGDKGTLTFTEGGPMGGYWKFVKDPKP